MYSFIRTKFLPIFACLSLLAIQTFAQEEGSSGVDENFHIFLLMGQSNMEGGRSVDGEMDTVKDPRILKLTDFGWVEACDPITNNYDVAIGPGLAFAKKLIAEDENIKVGLVPLSVGGSHIAEWMKGGRYYGPTLNAVAVARQQGVIKGILWHQGEHDGILKSTAAIYDQNLQALVDSLRIDLGDSELPFIVGGLAYGILSNTHHAEARLVWSRLHWVGNHFYRMGYVPSGDVPYLGDNLHFTTEGQREMGRRYADVYLKITGHWLEIGKQLLDATATDEGGGWKWSDQLGLYYDANFPIVKHAQLGWVKVDVFADMTLSIDSPVFGKFRTYEDSEENRENSRIYIYRESIYPEFALEYCKYGDQTYLVNLLADNTANNVFFNHTTGLFEQTIDNSPNFDQAGEIYHQAELEFGKTQQVLTDMTVAISLGTTWSEMTQLLKQAEQDRLYTIYYANDAIRFASTELPAGAWRDFWIERSQDLIDRINSEVEMVQDQWLAYTVSLYGN